ncbi:Interferon-induced [Nibea albiflora]|uniref:Interferon-induced n=1 Tax=Nibea albiflora TaxID=240163 RepID=A0ACB7EDU0_NIBAL|nr:Interferon-induced [Nibea albiflora]
METENFVAKLNEYAQKTRSLLKYEDVGCVGPDHIKTFTLRAVLNGKAYPDGVGKNKKEARQRAAENVLRTLLEESVDAKSTDNGVEAPTTPVHQTGITQTNFVCWLNEYGHKKRLNIRAVESTKLGPNNAAQCCSFVVGDKEYPAASGKTKREAKEEAAKLVFQEIFGSRTTETGEEKSISSSQPGTELSRNVSDICNKTKNLSIITADEGFSEVNFIGMVNHYCQKTKRTHDYVFEKRCGPSHNPQFFYKLVINDKPYPVGEGRNIKEAKQNAAQLAWSALQEQSDWDSKIQSPDVKPKIRFTSEYESIVFLGRGGFGCVFKAKQILLKRDFAIKIVRCKEKSLREVGALSDLNHLNIVRYYTCWLEDSQYQCDSSSGSYSSSQSSGDSSMKYLYIQMELCDTKTLRVWIDEKNVQNVKKSRRDSKRREESLTIAQQIVNGVKYIHSKMLIHRDLKPANIMFGQDGDVKIGDFGLVTAENDDNAENVIERTVYKGTPSYMAPEQKSRKIYDRKVDIFALGLIYFELLWNFSTGHERTADLIIRSMLCEKPEVRPEASNLKLELEDCSRKLMMLKDLHRDSLRSLRQLSFMMDTTNYVVELRDYATRTRSELRYVDLGFVGPDHDPTFTQRAVLNGKAYPDGVGKNKKDAKRNAAKNAIRCLFENEHEDTADLVSIRSAVSEDGTTSMSVESPTQFTSDFDIMECLGSGAFGCVYKVKHKLLKKHYAVKIVRCGKNSLREVGTLSDLLHHNIIRYYTFWVEDTGHQWNISADSCGSSSKSNNSSAKYLYIQMELCDPKTLKVWIDEKNTQSLQDSKRRQESLKIAQQIVGGVEYIHSQKHVHRDLKPENILFGLDGQVKIGDFGLVTSDYDNDDSALMERTGDRGTTTYMAPEQDQIIKSMLCEKPEDRPEANTLKAELEKFTQRVVLNGNIYPEGVGKSKKEAKHNAAKNFLERFLNSVDSTENAAEVSTAPIHQNVASPIHHTSITQTKYVCWLNEYCQSNKLDIRSVESTRPGLNSTTQCCSFVVGDTEYPTVTGKTKKEAKEEAAKLVYDMIVGSKSTEVFMRSAETEDSTPMTVELPTLESHNSSSQNMPMSISYSETADSSNPSMAQDAVNHKNMGNSKNETRALSRFTSDFDIIECLGSGSFGCVHKVKDKLLEKHYAVKIICCEEIKKSLREAKTLSDLLHQNIVRYYTSWMEDTGCQCDNPADSYSSSFLPAYNPSAKYLYIQMELCDTKTLKMWIDEKNTQPLQDSERREESLKIAQQIVSGIEYIHSKKQIHRDLKPANILFGLDEGEVVKIGDFGLVTRDDDALMDRTVSTGTPAYMAPEQRTKTYDRKVDIFALGLIYLELLWKVSTGHERGKVLRDAKCQTFPAEFSLKFPKEGELWLCVAQAVQSVSADSRLPQPVGERFIHSERAKTEGAV